LHLSHEMTALSVFGISCFCLIVFSCLLVGPISFVMMLLTPKTVVVACQRASGQCTRSKDWAFGPESSFPLSQLNDLFIVRNKTIESLGVRRPQLAPDIWFNSAESEKDKATLQRAVQSLHQFPGGNDASISVEIPNNRVSPFAMLFVIAVGLLLWKFVNSFIARVKIHGTKSNFTVVAHHVFGFRKKKQFHFASAVIARQKKTSTRYSPATIFAAIAADGEEFPILFEIMTKKGVQQQHELVTALGHFLGVPAVIE